VKIAFDVDDTLIDEEDNPRVEIIRLLRDLARLTESEIIVWSSRGKDWAEYWLERLELSNHVQEARGKDSDYQADIAFDDDATELHLARCLVIVKGGPSTRRRRAWRWRRT
jgi:FMN phosphatase YigB (HAD superfamily)